MEQHLRTLSWFNEKWPHYPKDTIFASHIGKRIGYALAFEIDDLQILTSVLRGPKGGLTGLLIIVDTSQPIEIDKLLCCDCSIGHSPWIISQIHLAIFLDNESFDEIVPVFIMKTMHDWKNNPELARTMSNIIGYGQPSVKALSGGSVSPR